MSSLRLATVDDLDHLYEMCLHFYEQSDYTFPLDREYGYTFLRSHLANPACLSLILVNGKDDIGCLLAFSAPHPFAPVKIANEIVWWVEPKYRGRDSIELLKAYEYWAINKMGCDLVCVTSTTSTDTRLDVIYKRRKYIKKENTWYKTMENF